MVWAQGLNMNRRDLIKAMFVAAPVAAAAEPPKLDPDRFTFDGWDIRWTGWKPLVNQDAYAGQWIAKPLGEPPIVEFYPGAPKYAAYAAYSSIPGTVGWAGRGFCLNIDLQPDQFYIEHDTPEGVRLQQKALALDKLIDFLRISRSGCK